MFAMSRSTLALLVTLVGIASGQSVGCAVCGAATNPNDFSSLANMEAAGWVFGTWGNPNFQFLTPSTRGTFCNGVPAASYCGFDHPGAGSITYTLQGVGTASFSFSNSWTGGTVTATLNGVSIATASARQLGVIATFNFTDGDVLGITEDPTAVHAINSLTFNCTGAPQFLYEVQTVFDSTAPYTPMCAVVTECSPYELQTAPATPTSDTVCSPQPNRTNCNVCGTMASNVNDFSSLSAMQASGWVFGWSDRFTFLPLAARGTFCTGVSAASYCGFQHPGDSLISYTLRGVGTATFSFGNSYTSGSVTAYVNGRRLGTARARTLSVNVTFAFNDGDVLTLTEAPSAVHSINGLWFTCPQRYMSSVLVPTKGIAPYSPTCALVSTCTSGQYQMAAATATSDTVCMPISSTCPAFHFQSGPATSTSDIQCSPITPCPPGQYQSGPATATANTQCSPVTATCPSGQFQIAPATPISDISCTPASTSCPSGQYQLAPATAMHDIQCTPVTAACPLGQYQSAPATATSDKVCSPITFPCPTGQYQTAAATATANTQCAPVTPSNCPPGQYQEDAPTATSNIVCTPVSTCATGQFAAVPATATSDVVCVCTPCTPSQAALAPTAAGGCPVCTDLTSPIGPTDDARISSGSNGQLSLDANTVRVKGVDLISWIQSLQAQIQELQRANAVLAAEVQEHH